MFLGNASQFQITAGHFVHSRSGWYFFYQCSEGSNKMFTENSLHDHLALFRATLSSGLPPRTNRVYSSKVSQQMGIQNDCLPSFIISNIPTRYTFGSRDWAREWEFWPWGARLGLRAERFLCTGRFFFITQRDTFPLWASAVCLI